MVLRLSNRCSKRLRCGYLSVGGGLPPAAVLRGTTATLKEILSSQRLRMMRATIRRKKGCAYQHSYATAC
jgi:hypothetical protein